MFGVLEKSVGIFKLTTTKTTKKTPKTLRGFNPRPPLNPPIPCPICIYIYILTNIAFGGPRQNCSLRGTFLTGAFFPGYDPFHACKYQRRSNKFFIYIEYMINKKIISDIYFLSPKGCPPNANPPTGMKKTILWGTSPKGGTCIYAYIYIMLNPSGDIPRRVVVLSCDLLFAS